MKHEFGKQLVGKVLISWGYTIVDTGKDTVDWVLRRPTHDMVLVDVKVQEKYDGEVTMSFEDYNKYSKMVADERFPELRIVFVDGEEEEVYASTFLHMAGKAISGVNFMSFDRAIFSTITKLTKGQAKKILKL